MYDHHLINQIRLIKTQDLHGVLRIIFNCKVFHKKRVKMPAGSFEIKFWNILCLGMFYLVYVFSAPGTYFFNAIPVN